MSSTPVTTPAMPGPLGAPPVVAKPRPQPRHHVPHHPTVRAHRRFLMRMAGADPDAPEAESVLAHLEQAAARAVEPAPGVLQLLENGAIAFRAAGGVWSRGELQDLTALDLLLLESAGRKFMAAQALNAGYCARGGLEEAHVAREIDGGAALEQAEIGAGTRVFNDLFARTIAAVP